MLLFLCIALPATNLQKPFRGMFIWTTWYSSTTCSAETNQHFIL